MMNRKINQFFSITALLLLAGILITGCDKNFENPSAETTEKFTDMEIDAGFKFETTRDVDITINIESTDPDMFPHVIRVWEANPEGNLRQIKKGMTNPQRSFSTRLNIPSYLEEIYVQSSSASGYNEVVTLMITGEELSYTFQENKNTNAFKSVSAVDPGCPSGECDETLSGTQNNVDINNNKIYCVPEGGNFIANNIKFKGGTLRVCGNLIATNINVQGNNGGELIVSTNGTVQANNVQYNKLDKVINFGSFTESGGSNINGSVEFENNGTFSSSGQLNVQTDSWLNYGTVEISGGVNNNGGDMTNEGDMTVTGNFNNNGEVTNSGNLNVSGNYHINGNAEMTNHCSLIVNGDFHQNDEFDNYGYVEVGNQFTLNGSSETNMHEQSLVVTENLTVNGNLYGPAQSCARINIASTTNINGGATLGNYLDICDADGVENNWGNTGDNVSFDCSCFIPQTACNPGSGDPPFTDTDGDGVNDDEDDFPEDPTRAFISTESATLAYEDLWPALGDYDFNDLVVSADYEIVTDAQNLIVDLIADFKIEAGGAGLDNGFGFSLPVPPSTVESVSGSELVSNIVTLDPAGYESGHNNNTVVIVYDAINTMLGTAMFNTVPGEPYLETDTTTINIHFSTPQADIGTMPYNPFIFVGGERGKEIHLIDNEPTELVDQSWFGMLNDDSDPAGGRYYVTETNLPWAISIPDEFDYPVEKADIVQTYLKFAQWAQSGGVLYSDWYFDLPGYRNDANIYTPN